MTNSIVGIIQVEYMRRKDIALDRERRQVSGVISPDSSEMGSRDYRPQRILDDTRSHPQLASDR